MLKHELNLAKEHARTRNFIRNLRNFVSSPRFEYLGAEHKDAMLDELTALEDLDAALTRRMELLGIPI